MNTTSKRTVRYFISYTREDGGIPDQFLTELRSQLILIRFQILNFTRQP